MWVDLTVPKADALRDFYKAVVGWKSRPVDMGGYSDHAMTPANRRKPVAGICHARGENSDLPPHWLVYFTVADLTKSLRSCRARGGKVLIGPKGTAPHSRYAVIQDPSGAYAALVQPPHKH
jgi:predicted enzyme related to lactoylglutathione lyase